MSAQVEYGLGGERIVRLDGRDSRYALAASPDDMREAIRRTEFMKHLALLAKKSDLFPELKMAASGSAGYIVNTGSSAISLTAATAKTVWYINGGSAKASTITEIAIGFDGVSSSAVPALIEVVYGTKASNSTPGTGSTSFTPVIVRGWGNGAAAAAAANNCSSEPTTLTSTRQYLLTPNGGLMIVLFPLGREPSTTIAASTSGLQIGCRVTAPATVNVRSSVEIEE